MKCWLGCEESERANERPVHGEREKVVSRVSRVSQRVCCLQKG